MYSVECFWEQALLICAENAFINETLMISPGNIFLVCVLVTAGVTALVIDHEASVVSEEERVTPSKIRIDRRCS